MSRDERLALAALLVLSVAAAAAWSVGRFQTAIAVPELAATSAPEPAQPIAPAPERSAARAPTRFQASSLFLTSKEIETGKPYSPVRPTTPSPSPEPSPSPSPMPSPSPTPMPSPSPSPMPSPSPTPSPSWSEPSFEIEGIIFARAGSRVIVAGDVYAEGVSFTSSGATVKVVAISPLGATFESDGKKFERKLAETPK